ncbi:MAG: hypothetical protein JNJ54_32605 [Myxococcaceae bacterium]|nr:hypothetical protein [Myxococcaceae bacterium]
MAERPDITLDDLKTLARGQAPDLAQAIIQFAAQPQPPPETVPEGALLPEQFEQMIKEAQREPREAQRRMKVALLWRRYLTQPDPPPSGKYLLADFITELYLGGGEPTRSALLELIRTAPLDRGLWGGLKRVFKLAEDRQDALFFGAVLARLEVSEATPAVTRGTIVYLQRRGSRYLRNLARAVPELYPVFAGATLAEVPADATLWRGVAVYRVINERGERFENAWKLSPDPLMVLLEAAKQNEVAKFAIDKLKKHFPALLRQTNPAWLQRLAQRPIAAVHELLIDILTNTPELHPAKLEGLGLKPTVLMLLLSPSAGARKYAIEYARAHAADLPAEQVVNYALKGQNDTRAWALSVLEARNAKTIGLPLLSKLLGDQSTTAWAAARLEAHFDRNDLTDAFFIELVFGAHQQREWARKYLAERVKVSEQLATFVKALFADPRRQDPANVHNLVRFTRQLLTLVAPEHLGAAWLLPLLSEPPFRQLADEQLRKAKSLPGLDLEAVKGLVFDRTVRELALHLLSTHATFKAIGLPWLLALARRTDPTLSGFATRMLLGQVDPRDFGDGDVDRGAKRLLELATGAKEPDPVRLFAQTYLRCHHPTVGPQQPEAIAHAIKPRLALAQFPAEPFWKALFDARADVRRFAVTITRADLRRWGAHLRVYELADSEHKEVRNLCLNALENAGAPTADAACTLTVEEIDAAQVFRLTESRIRQSRDVAMELIAKHYQRLGGPERLAWLMESADRGVRTMAVRMLWERHRPASLPDGWKPKGPAKLPESAGRFQNVQVLQDFLRTLLFGLPPGRAAEAREGELPRRNAGAQVAKRRAIEAARALAVEDEGFARAVSPLFLEFSGSIARGEWQSCLAALATVKLAHPHLDVGLSLKA